MAAVLCNVVLVAFTCLVLATEGLSREAPYVIFTLLLLAVPTLTAAVLVQRGLHRAEGAPGPSARTPRANQIGVLFNLWLLATAGWAIFDQYPHPEEQGVLLYTVVVVLTPILSIVALLTSGKRQPG